MEFNEYIKHDAMGLAELVKKKEVTPAELCEAAISRIEGVNPRVNAVVTKMYDIARTAAKGDIPDGPFRGVPFLLKDLMAAFAGVPLTGSSKAYRKYVPQHDSELVARFKKAGLLVVGKSNTPEFGLMGVTEPELFGACRNPWNTGHTPGGSSGGSAAAVAAGMVPMASGGDGGGSIRIPASCCGLFGLKPTRGRNPMGPDRGQYWQGAVVEHVISRSVRDSAAVLDATNGADPGAPYVIQPPADSYLAEASRAPRALKIAFDTSSPIGKGVHPECKKAVEDAARLLESLGHNVEEGRPQLDGKEIAVGFITMVCAEVAADVNEVERLFGAAAARNELELGTRTLGLLGRTFSACDLSLAIRAWEKAARVMGGFFKKYDIYMTPTMARPPVKIGELGGFKPAEKVISTLSNALSAGKFLRAAGVVEKVAIDNLAAMPFTQLGNITGLPSMSAPLHWTPDGLPVGVCFNAPFGDEATLFRLAAQLEKAAPWFDKRPADIK